MSCSKLLGYAALPARLPLSEWAGGGTGTVYKFNGWAFYDAFSFAVRFDSTLMSIVSSLLSKISNVDFPVFFSLSFRFRDCVTLNVCIQLYFATQSTHLQLQLSTLRNSSLLGVCVSCRCRKWSWHAPPRKPHAIVLCKSVYIYDYERSLHVPLLGCGRRIRRGHVTSFWLTPTHATHQQTADRAVDIHRENLKKKRRELEQASLDAASDFLDTDSNATFAMVSAANVSSATCRSTRGTLTNQSIPLYPSLRTETAGASSWWPDGHGKGPPMRSAYASTETT